jgi:cytochrome P450
MSVSAGDVDLPRDAKYLRAVMYEVIRLRSTVFQLQRTVLDNEVSLTDVDSVEYKLRRGTEIVVLPFVMHHDSELFGAEVDRFDPQRFLTMEETKKRLYFAGFGFGPRSCVGKGITEHAVLNFLAYVLLNFDLKCPNNIENQLDMSAIHVLPSGWIRPKQDAVVVVSKRDYS